MENLFQFIMSTILGKRWINIQMKHGLKAAIFVKRMEIEMNKKRYTAQEAAVKELDEKLKMPPADLEDHKKLNEQKGMAEQQLDKIMADLGGMYDQLSADKRKLEFLKGYKI